MAVTKRTDKVLNEIVETEDGVVPYTPRGLLVESSDINKEAPFECVVETRQLFRGGGGVQIDATLNGAPVVIDILFRKGNGNKVYSVTDIERCDTEELLYSEVDTAPFIFTEADNAYKVSYTRKTIPTNPKQRLTEIKIIDVTEEG